ncbi:MAG: TIR domain-containing protein [Erysipelotrichaceae bacterium]
MNIADVLHVLENTTEANESAIIEVQAFLADINFEVDKLHAINMLLKVNNVPEIDNLLKRELILLLNNYPCDIKKPYIFISYSSKDWKYVYPHVIKMKFQGINVWIDIELENHSGEKWNTTVKQVLMKHQLKMMIFFMSKNAFTSGPIFQELLFSQKDKFAGGPNKNFTPYLIPINIIENFDANL